MSEIIKDLNWRYATKSFDTSKKVSEEDLQEIVESFRLTPSSFGLEPWKLVVVETQELKDKLKEFSFNQSQISDSSHVLVFTRVVDLNDEYVDKFLDNQSKITGASREDLEWYEKVMKWFLLNLDENSKIMWAKEQVNIALWNVMHTLARKQIDSCAIGWFESSKYDEFLGLTEKWLASVVVLPIWYRQNDDKYAIMPKVRFSVDEIMIKM